MPRYRIEVTCTKTEIYEVEAVNEDEASDLWGHGKYKYKGCRDENSDVVEIMEIKTND